MTQAGQPRVVVVGAEDDRKGTARVVDVVVGVAERVALVAERRPRRQTVPVERRRRVEDPFENAVGTRAAAAGDARSIRPRLRRRSRPQHQRANGNGPLGERTLVSSTPGVASRVPSGEDPSPDRAPLSTLTMGEIGFSRAGGSFSTQAAREVPLPLGRRVAQAHLVVRRPPCGGTLYSGWWSGSCPFECGGDAATHPEHAERDRRIRHGDVDPDRHRVYLRLSPAFQTPTRSPTPLFAVPRPTPSAATPTASPTETATPTASPTATASPTPTVSPSPTATPSATSTETPTATQTPEPTTLHGKVTNGSGEALSGVMVTAYDDVLKGSVSVFSGADGRYEFPPIASTTYRVRANRIGWRDSFVDAVQVARAERGKISRSPRPTT